MALSAPANRRLHQLATRVRADILRATTAAGSGHPTSSLSATDLMVTLLFGGTFRADLGNPGNPDNDRLVFSKGHASPLFYSLYAAAGKVSDRELLTLRKHTSRLEGHPMLTFPYTEVPTGSLGQGLAAGLGMALAGRIQQRSFRTYVLLGDSEMAEGSVWEAMQLASHQRVDTLTAILDANRLGQSVPTMVQHHLNVYAARARAFGWNVLVIDGHDIRTITRAYATALRIKHGPTMIIAKTFKGRGVPFLENVENWHGKAVPKERLDEALSALGPINRTLRGIVRKPTNSHPSFLRPQRVRRPHYDLAKPVAPRKALGNALVRLAPRFPHLVVLDAEVKNSTYTELFEKTFPARFIQSYIAEQAMVSMATGLATRGMLPVAATFAAFFTRAYDQLRMAQYAETHQVFIGTHAGVSIGEDGASQMGLEDIALFRTIGSTVLYPADAYAAEGLLELALKNPGMHYIRATRADEPHLYGPRSRFRIGGSTVLRRSPRDRVTLVAAGVTLFEALKSTAALEDSNIPVRIIDLYSVNPVDSETLRTAVRETKRLVVVEDHRGPGGIAEAVRTALGSLAGTVTSLCVRKTPHSGKPAQLLHDQGIDTTSIIRTVRALLKSRSTQ